MLPSVTVKAFTISELLRENQQGGKISPHSELRLRHLDFSSLHVTCPFVFIDMFLEKDFHVQLHHMTKYFPQL